MFCFWGNDFILSVFALSRTAVELGGRSQYLIRTEIQSFFLATSPMLLSFKQLHYSKMAWRLL